MKAVLKEILNICLLEIAPLFFILSRISPEIGFGFSKTILNLSPSVNLGYSEWLLTVLNSFCLVWTLTSSMNGRHPSSLIFGFPMISTDFMYFKVGYMLRSVKI